MSEDKDGKISIGLHPLGGIAITVRNREDQEITSRVSPNEAWQIIGTLSALSNILVQNNILAQMEEAQRVSNLIVPRT